MEDVYQWEFNLIVRAIILLLLAGIGFWFLVRVDKEARRIVESRRAYGYAVSNYEDEVAKWKKRAFVFYSVTTGIFLVAAVLALMECFR